MTSTAYGTPRLVARGLRFPEGPIARPDGSLLFAEIARGSLSRLLPDGRIETVATPGGGPNGAAMGPDGKVYVCNNGGFAWIETPYGLLPHGCAGDHRGGAIQRIDPETGEVETVLTHVDGHALSAPNDLVFAADGSFWFTDSGHERGRVRDLGAVYWARADGTEARQVVFPLLNPNGIGLSPDGRTLYVALTIERQVLAFSVTGPGQVAPGATPLPGRVLYGFAGRTFLDSLGVQRDGAVVVATILENPGLAVIAPDGGLRAHVPVPGIVVTNVAFSPDGQTAFVTVGSSGEIYAIDWPTPGLTRNFPA